MTDLVVRRLHVDLKNAFERRWNGGDAFRSALFNALSMSFPLGEQYFIDSLREGAKILAPQERARMDADLRGFIGQEATHRHLHALYNEQLERQGFNNVFERRIARRMKANAHRNIRIHVAATAATEHFTAIFANWLMRHPAALEGADARLRTLWLWHSAEESEHRSVAFDLYRAIGGDEDKRRRVFRYVTFTFLTDLSIQTLLNLWHDRSLFRWSTWASAARLLFGEDGMIRGNLRYWKAYFSPGFHPSLHDASLSQAWLQQHSDQFTVLDSPSR